MTGNQVLCISQISVFKEFRSLRLSIKIIKGFLAHMCDVNIFEIGAQFA